MIVQLAEAMAEQAAETFTTNNFYKIEQGPTSHLIIRS